ncbi:MAG: hypothetical protein PHS41_09890 [Victivallaceae bacterium]|nr:hypothetical protein [Victivallaceae bacterium]
MWKTLIRPAMIFVPFAAGVIFPQAHVLNDPPINAVRYCLITMVFLSCLQMRLGDLKIRKEHWMILGLNLLMGIAPYALFRVLMPDEKVLALAAFFVGITPTATAAPVVVAFLNGRIGFALTGFTITNVGVSLSLLVLLPLVANNFTMAFAGNVAWTLVQVLVFPFVLAMLVRGIYPPAQQWPKRAKTFSFSLWSFTLFVLASIARQHFIDNPDESFLRVLAVAGISLAICILNFTLGKQLSSKRYSRESSQILGQKNTTFSMYLALHYAGALVAMGPIFYVLWHNCWNAWQMYSYDRRKLKRARKQEQAKAASSGRK